MKLVIDIPDKIYSFITTECNDVTISENEAPFEYIIRGIIDGTVLPKGHGDLIDRDELILPSEEIISRMAIASAQTVIEADKEAENE